MSHKTHAFTLFLPAAGAFRSLAPQIASRYAELAGGAAPDVEAFAQSVGAAIDRVSMGLEPGAHVHLAFAPDATGLHVDVSCEGRRESVDVTIPLAQR